MREYANWFYLAQHVVGTLDVPGLMRSTPHRLYRYWMAFLMEDWKRPTSNTEGWDGDMNKVAKSIALARVQSSDVPVTIIHKKRSEL